MIVRMALRCWVAIEVALYERSVELCIGHTLVLPFLPFQAKGNFG